jgi:hypothetical protein
MTDVPVLLDECMEPEVRHRLRNYGHTVEHVLTHDTLQRGDPDRNLADYSLEHNVLIVTHDPDFGEDFDESEYWGALGFSDDDWSGKQVADVTHAILGFYDKASLRAFNPVGREWLSRI